MDMYPPSAPQVNNPDLQLVPTTLQDLARYAQGTVVRLPDFADGQPFVARVRRPSMLELAKNGQIPNSLLGAANELFNGQSVDSDNEDMLSQMFGVCETMAKATLIQPTYEDVVNSGLMLTDEQFIAIFNFSQSGQKALESFR